MANTLVLLAEVRGCHGVTCWLNLCWWYINIFILFCSGAGSGEICKKPFSLHVSYTGADRMNLSSCYWQSLRSFESSSGDLSTDITVNDCGFMSRWDSCKKMVLTQIPLQSHPIACHNLPTHDTPPKENMKPSTSLASKATSLPTQFVKCCFSLRGSPPFSF